MVKSYIVIALIGAASAAVIAVFPSANGSAPSQPALSRNTEAVEVPAFEDPEAAVSQSAKHLPIQRNKTMGPSVKSPPKRIHQLEQRLSELEEAFTSLRAQIMLRSSSADASGRTTGDGQNEDPGASMDPTYFDTQIVALEERMNLPETDTTWSYETEGEIADALQQLDLAADIVDLRCRRSLCRIELESMNEGIATDVQHPFSFVPWTGPGLVHRDPLDPSRIVLFLARDEAAMSELQP